MLGYERKQTIESMITQNRLGLLGSELDSIQTARYNRIKQAWNFYEGYHWEDIPSQDSAEITTNYCRAFVDKFVAFELGKAFTFTTSSEVDGIKVTDDGRTVFEYLEDVWEDNKQYELCAEFGQMKSITGEAWIQVRYFTPEELEDPFGEYPNGRLRLMLMSTSVIFPEYDPHDKDKLIKLTVLYTYKTKTKTFLSKEKEVFKIFKQVWTKDTCVTEDGVNEPVTTINKYGFIPFIMIKNLPISDRNEGRGDLDDIIPLNVELNLKSSNVSEILDYHASPITVVYGAKVGNLEKGANKIWGGLPKDAKVQNLELQGDMASSTNYSANLKLSMCEVGGIPETVLGGAQAISNTSGVALQYINLPLIEKTNIKKKYTETGLENLNKAILLISILEGVISKPDNVSLRDYLHTEVTIPDTLPKDMLLELQQIAQEMKLGLEDREGAMKRLGKEDIANTLSRIDKDRNENPEVYGLQNFDKELNSGFLNGQTPVEQVRTEMTGSNGMNS